MSQTPTSTVPALVLRRTYKAPRERVYEAWTNPELFRAWMCPPEHVVEEASVDARPGGRYRIVFRSDGGEKLAVGGVFSEARKPERLVCTWRWEEDDPADEHDTHLTIELIERGGETELVLTQEHFRNDESRTGHEHGWSPSLDKLGTIF
jgi:uncharacterized protein YndB with AHSA1/START domain